MARHKDRDWNLPDKAQDWGQVRVALLMDIRDELREVRQRLSVLQCPNFIAIPQKLDAIQRNTAKPKRKRRTPKA